MILIAARRVRRTRTKIQNTYSRGGVPQVYLTLKKEVAMFAQERIDGAAT